MSEQLERDAVVAEARAWVRTPYVHQSRLKGIGADCTFFAMVYEACGLVPHVDIPHYSPQAHLHRVAAIYEGIVGRHAHRTESPLRGDIVLYHFGRAYSHGGVLIEDGWPSRIVHGDMEAGFVLIGHGDGGRLQGAPRMFFTLWPTEKAQA
jgi:cell wall-associated NlpC family hydrolase